MTVCLGAHVRHFAFATLMAVTAGLAGCNDGPSAVDIRSALKSDPHVRGKMAVLANTINFTYAITGGVSDGLTAETMLQSAIIEDVVCDKNGDDEKYFCRFKMGIKGIQQTELVNSEGIFFKSIDGWSVKNFK